MWEDIDTLVLAWLEPLGFLASTQVPVPRPPAFIRVMRTGNQRMNVAFRRVQLTVECWDEAGEAAAERMADLVEARLEEWPRVPTGSPAWLSGPTPQVDEETGLTGANGLGADMLQTSAFRTVLGISHSPRRPV